MPKTGDGPLRERRPACRSCGSVLRPSLVGLAHAEYPWERGETVLVPCKYAFPTLSLLDAHGGRAFLKLVDRAFRDY
jgi:hypothetical protein